MLLADIMREATLRTQLVVATHSDRLISFLRPEEVLIMDAGENGLAKLTWADSLDLDKWLHDYSLGEMWRSGVLGARAWE
jgi:predicted ATPase